MPGEPEFVAPASVAEALDALADPDAVALAGGTSVALLIGQGLLEPARLVWLGRVAGLREITEEGGVLRVGAGVTLRELARHPLVRAALPGIARAAGLVGNPRVRSVATVGGALVHADPRQDLPPALVAAGAEVEVAGPGGTRSLPAGELAVGLMDTVLAPDELVVAVRVPLVAGRRSCYLRFNPGSVADYPSVSAAATATLAPDGTVSSASLALGGVAGTVLAVPEAGELAGAPVRPERIAEVARAAAARARPVSDRLGSAEYKREMAAVWARRALAACLDGSGSGSVVGSGPGSVVGSGPGSVVGSGPGSVVGSPGA